MLISSPDISAGTGSARPSASIACTAGGSGGTVRVMPRAATLTRPAARSISMFVAVGDAGDVAFDHRQPVVDRIAEKLPAERRRDDRRHAHQVHHVHRLLARRIDAEVFAGDDDVAGLEARGKTRRDLLERVLRDVGVVLARQIFARAMNIGVDVVAEQTRAAIDESCHAVSITPPASLRRDVRGSVMMPVSAEAATVAAEPIQISDLSDCRAGP